MKIGKIAIASLAATLAAVPLASANSATVSPTSFYSHIDAVENALRAHSPSLEGSVWQRTKGNILAGGAASGKWILNTPGCWGDPQCSERPGTEHVLQEMRDTIGSAQHTIDISTLAPLASGGFLDAISDGLRTAANNNAEGKIKVRILGGGQPTSVGSTESEDDDDDDAGKMLGTPEEFIGKLNQKIGTDSSKLDITVALGGTDSNFPSWNHTKIINVDRHTVITGGMNVYHRDYLMDGPVDDLMIKLSGPAALSASRFLDNVWVDNCRRLGTKRIFIAHNSPDAMTSEQCPARLSSADGTDAPSGIPLPGGKDVLAIGGLGFGILDDQKKPLVGSGKPIGNLRAMSNYVNDNDDYDLANPDLTAIRALISSATTSVFISQQDVTTTPNIFMPLKDTRIFDALADKIIAKIPVTVIISNTGNFIDGLDGYSTVRTMDEVANAMRESVLGRPGMTPEEADKAIRDNFKFASFKAADKDKWDTGGNYKLHNKLVMVDDSAFYVGSRNIYPAPLQEFGYIIEDTTAASELREAVIDQQIRYSFGG